MKDDDWRLGSEELLLETEEREEEAENGGELIDSEDDEIKEEEDKMEDGDTPAVSGNDNDSAVLESDAVSYSNHLL